MSGTWTITRYRGIDVGIHYSWLIVFVAFTYILAESQLPNLYDDWTSAQYWTAAAVAVILLFLSVLLHEFGHAITAQSRGVGVRSITLFIFGGVAQLEQDSEEAIDEFLIAIAGPIVSVALGGVFGLLWLLFRDTSEQVSAVLGFLAWTNIVLAVFNMIPGFPLDGGRVLRAVLWGATDNMRKATRIAVAIGTAVGMGFVFLGILGIISGNIVNGIWAIVIGWFLQNAASESMKQVEQEQLFRDVYVRDLMNSSPITVAPDVDLETLANDYVLRQNARGLPVVAGNQLIGLITVNDLKKVNRADWPRMRVDQVMTPASQLVVARPGSPIDEALQAMATGDFHQIPVLDGGRFLGLLTRFDVLRWVNTRSELGARQ